MVFANAFLERVLFVWLLSWGFVGCVTSQDVADYPWRTDEKGLLWMDTAAQPHGSGPGSRDAAWVPLFPELVDLRPDNASDRITNLAGLGLFCLIPLLLTHEGGAACIEEAPRRMSKLGIRMTMNRDVMRDVSPDPRLDWLRLRWLESVDAAEATFVLYDIACDPRRDQMVRRGAAAVFATRMRQRAGVQDERVAAVLQPIDMPASLDSSLRRIPNDADWLVCVDCRSLHGSKNAMQAWRRFHQNMASAVSLERGSALPPEALIDMQSVIDRPGQLPYELACLFGNWRVDCAVFAGATGADGWWMVTMRGDFDANAIETGFEALRFPVTRDGDGDVVVRIAEYSLWLNEHGLEVVGLQRSGAPKGRWATLLQERPMKDANVWVHVPVQSKLWPLAGLPQGKCDATLDVRTGSARAHYRADSPEHAERVMSTWRAWQAERSCEPEGGVPGRDDLRWRDVEAADPGLAGYADVALAWRQCVSATTVVAKGDEVRWELGWNGMKLDRLVGLLWLPPKSILKQY